MQTYRLTAHPAQPASDVVDVRASWAFEDSGDLLLKWRIDGAQDVFLLDPAGRGRSDDLWKTTCFELFLDQGDGAYREFNFSPSGQWAVYDFSSTRQFSGNAEIDDYPSLEIERGESIITGTVRISSSALGKVARGSLCAVIEEKGGVLSYWANTHAQDKPDFHDPACFDLNFAAPDQT